MARRAKLGGVARVIVHRISVKAASGYRRVSRKWTGSGAFCGNWAGRLRVQRGMRRVWHRDNGDAPKLSGGAQRRKDARKNGGAWRISAVSKRQRRQMGGTRGTGPSLPSSTLLWGVISNRQVLHSWLCFAGFMATFDPPFAACHALRYCRDVVWADLWMDYAVVGHHLTCCPSCCRLFVSAAVNYGGACGCSVRCRAGRRSAGGRMVSVALSSAACGIRRRFDYWATWKHLRRVLLPHHCGRTLRPSGHRCGAALSARLACCLSILGTSAARRFSGALLLSGAI